MFRSPPNNAGFRWFILAAALLFIGLVVVEPANRSGSAFLLLVIFLPLLIVRYFRRSLESLFDRRQR